MNYRDTRLYASALELYAQCFRVSKRLPPGFAFLADQLRRAASSVPLTFAEGCRCSSAKERARYFGISAGSAREVASILDVAHLSDAITVEERDAWQDRCDHICAMLHRFH